MIPEFDSTTCSVRYSFRISIILKKYNSYRPHDGVGDGKALQLIDNDLKVEIHLRDKLEYCDGITRGACTH